MIHTYESQEYSIVDIMRKGNNETIKVKPDDIVLFTNGSMTQNTTRGDYNTPAKINTSDDKGCYFGFLGQYAEIPNDCVFTVEYSVRSAMMAVYGLMGLDKKVTEIYPSQYDVRVLMNATKACLGLDHLDLKALPLGALLKGSELEKLI